MRRTTPLLAALLAALAVLLSLPGPARAQFRGRGVYRPYTARYRPYPPNRMPGWDWWRTYPWSPYNYGRNPYNPIVVPYVYPYPEPYPAYVPSTSYYGTDSLTTSEGSTATTSSEPYTLIPHAVPSLGSYVPANLGAVRLRLPDAFADVRFDGDLTSSMGYVRFYETPPLEAGKTYRYTVKVSWTRDGSNVTEERLIRVRPGHTTLVDFTRPVARK
jgi:uncharacterized protein (TIGR03000 family)